MLWSFTMNLSQQAWHCHDMTFRGKTLTSLTSFYLINLMRMDECDGDISRCNRDSPTFIAHCTFTIAERMAIRPLLDVLNHKPGAPELDHHAP